MENINKIENIEVYYSVSLKADITSVCEELGINREDIKSYDITDSYKLEITMKNGETLYYELEGFKDIDLGYVQDFIFLDSDSYEVGV